MIAEVDLFSKMLIAVSSIGIFITQENGHRYINIDVRELSHFYPDSLHNKEFATLPANVDDLTDPIFTIKFYGSYLSALLYLEKLLSIKLIDVYDNLNYADTIIGLEAVE